MSEQRFPIPYTKPITLDKLKVGDKIEAAWRWEDDLIVKEVRNEGVVFNTGELRLFSDYVGQKFRLCKIRMSKYPEHFHQP